MRKIGVLLLISSVLYGCGMRLFVPIENVIKTSSGYLLITAEYVEFIPIKVDPNLSLEENLRQNQMQKRFYLYDLSQKQKKSFIELATTVLPMNSKILAVELEYRVIWEANRRLRKESFKCQTHYLLVEGVTYDFRVSKERISVVKLRPLVSK